MQSIKKKLNSSTGSSLFLAIVFFMFAFFVGGTVLAAATANAGRLVNLEEERESYYRQRNMAMMLQQMIGEDPINRPEINVNIEMSQLLSATNPKTAFDLKPTGPSVYKSKVTEENCENILQQCLKSYIRDTAIGVYVGNTDITVGTTPGTESYGPANASGTVTIGEMKANYECQFDFSRLDSFGKVVFTVLDDNGNPGQFRVTVPVTAYKNEAEGSREPFYQQTGANSYYQLTRYTTTSYVVTLGSAVIGKNTDVKTVEGQP